MVEGRRKDQWDHTAALLSLIANAHRDVKKRRSPFTSDDFHPFAEGRKRAGGGTRITPSNISLLKVFVPPKA